MSQKFVNTLKVPKSDLKIIAAHRDMIESYESELTDEAVKDIARMTPEEAFDAWCNYEGLINYGPVLRKLWEVLNS